MADINLFNFKGIQHGDKVVNGGDISFDRETLPVQPAGWQAEEEDAPDVSVRLDVLEIK